MARRGTPVQRQGGAVTRGRAGEHVAVHRDVAPTIVAAVEARHRRGPDGGPVEAADERRRRRTAPATSRDEEPGRPVVDQLGHRAAVVGDDRRAAGHRLDDAVAERLVEVDEVQQGVGAAEDLGALLGRRDRTEVADPVAVEVGRDLVAEVAARPGRCRR